MLPCVSVLCTVSTETSESRRVYSSSVSVSTSSLGWTRRTLARGGSGGGGEGGDAGRETGWETGRDGTRYREESRSFMRASKRAMEDMGFAPGLIASAGEGGAVEKKRSRIVSRFEVRSGVEGCAGGVGGVGRGSMRCEDVRRWRTGLGELAGNFEELAEPGTRGDDMVSDVEEMYDSQSSEDSMEERLEDLDRIEGESSAVLGSPLTRKSEEGEAGTAPKESSPCVNRS